MISMIVHGSYRDERNCVSHSLHVSQWISRLSYSIGCPKSQSLARLREIAKINTRKIVAILKSQNFVLANNSNNKVSSSTISHSSAKNVVWAKQKKVSASTNPTDRVLKRRPGTFFRFLVRYFLAPLRAWPVASSIVIARKKWTSKKSRKREGDLDCWPRLLSRHPGARGDVRHYSIDATRFLSAAANRASFDVATCDLLLQRRNWHVGLLHFFGRFVLPQLISCFSSTAMSMAVCQLPRGQELSLFAEDVFCTWTIEDATLLSVLRVALGDNKSLHASHFNSRDLTKQEKTGAVSFKVSHHRRKRSSGRGARAEEARDSTADLSSLHTYVANRPSHTRGLGDSGINVLLAARLKFFYMQIRYANLYFSRAGNSNFGSVTGRRNQSCCSLLLKSRDWHTGFACKKISAKKKTDRPARKHLSHVSRSRDLFLFGLVFFFFFFFFFDLQICGFTLILFRKLWKLPDF